MLSIAINSDMKALWPEAVLGCIQCKVKVKESPAELLEEIEGFGKELQSKIAKVPDIPKRKKLRIQEVPTRLLARNLVVTAIQRRLCAAASFRGKDFIRLIMW